MTNNRYSRQILFEPIGEEGQKKLLQSKVLIVGMGALGTVLANHLVRAGVGHVVFVDRDFVEPSNLQRQMLYDEQDAIQSLPKAVAAEQKLKQINSEVTIEGHLTDITPANIADFTVDVDIILDGTDNFQTRFLINDYCMQVGIPYIYGGAVATRGMQATFLPGKTPCLRCLIEDQGGAAETCDTSGVLAPIIDIIASYQVMEAIKLLTEQEHKLRSGLLSVDLWNNTYHELKWRKPKENCRSCQRHEYPALQISEGQQILSLCGRESIQIAPPIPQNINLDEWKSRLERVCEVQLTPFLLRCTFDKLKLVLFKDGRVLIQGTSNITEAKAMYAKYIGM